MRGSVSYLVQILPWKGKRAYPFGTQKTRRKEEYGPWSQHCLAYFGMLRRRGVRMISINEPEVEGSMAVLVEPLLAAVGESFIAQIAEDTLRGLKEIARQAFSGGGRPPRGYRAVKKVVGLKRSGEPNGSRTVALDSKPSCCATGTTRHQGLEARARGRWDTVTLTVQELSEQ